MVADDNLQKLAAVGWETRQASQSTAIKVPWHPNRRFPVHIAIEKGRLRRPRLFHQATRTSAPLLQAAPLSPLSSQVPRGSGPRTRSTRSARPRRGRPPVAALPAHQVYAPYSLFSSNFLRCCVSMLVNLISIILKVWYLPLMEAPMVNMIACNRSRT
jgi:hypothetical protein